MARISKIDNFGRMDNNSCVKSLCVMYSWSDSKLNEHLKSRQISQAGEHETMDKVLHNAGNSKILHNFLEIVTVAVAEPGCDMKLQ